MNENPLPPEDPRVRLAGERTLLAWIRTGLAMMGFGFVVARFGLFLSEISPHHPESPGKPHGLSIWIGTLLILLGVGVCLISAWQHHQFLKAIDRGESAPRYRFPLEIVLSVVLAALGVGMTGYLLLLHW